MKTLELIDGEFFEISNKRFEDTNNPAVDLHNYTFSVRNCDGVEADFAQIPLCHKLKVTSSDGFIYNLIRSKEAFRAALTYCKMSKKQIDNVFDKKLAY